MLLTASGPRKGDTRVNTSAGGWNHYRCRNSSWPRTHWLYFLERVVFSEVEKSGKGSFDFSCLWVAIKWMKHVHYSAGLSPSKHSFLIRPESVSPEKNLKSDRYWCCVIHQVGVYFRVFFMHFLLIQSSRNINVLVKMALDEKFIFRKVSSM